MYKEEVLSPVPLPFRTFFIIVLDFQKSVLDLRQQRILTLLLFYFFNLTFFFSSLFSLCSTFLTSSAIGKFPCCRGSPDPRRINCGFIIRAGHRPAVNHPVDSEIHRDKRISFPVGGGSLVVGDLQMPDIFLFLCLCQS